MATYIGMAAAGLLVLAAAWALIEKVRVHAQGAHVVRIIRELPLACFPISSAAGLSRLCCQACCAGAA